MAQWGSRKYPVTATSSDDEHSSLVEAVVAAARFERSMRRARHVRVERGRANAATSARHAGVPLAVAARELRRLTRA